MEGYSYWAPPGAPPNLVPPRPVYRPAPPPIRPGPNYSKLAFRLIGLVLNGFATVCAEFC